MPKKDDAQLFADVYSMFTNNGFIEDSEVIGGFSVDRFKIDDLVTQTDLTRFGMSLLL